MEVKGDAPVWPSLNHKLIQPIKWGFLKVVVPFWGVLVRRIIAFWGFSCGPPLLGKHQKLQLPQERPLILRPAAAVGPRGSRSPPKKRLGLGFRFGVRAIQRIGIAGFGLHVSYSETL